MNYLTFQADIQTSSASSPSAGSAASSMLCRVSWNGFGMLTGIEFLPVSPENLSGNDWAPGPIQDLVVRLKSYFRHGSPLGTLPWEWIDQSQWTPFQYQVYSTIAKIPHGETRTYGWVAHRIGRMEATRAVGQALKKNPLPVFIPCHRVVAVNSLGGFMGSSDPDQAEVVLKKRLLALEQGYLNPSFSFMSGLTNLASLAAVAS